MRTFIAGLLALSAAAHAGESFDPGRLSLTLRIGDLESPYSVLALSANPGEQLELELSRPGRVVDGDRISDPATRHVWTAPERTGLRPLRIEADGESMALNVFVTRPASEIRDQHLSGYRIGAYSKRPFRGLDAYRAPRGFIEITPDVLDVRVAPHFTLRQFLCKQESDWPKYLVLRPRVLVKLERILELLNRDGVRTDELTVMSAFRTPWYNAVIGNKTSSSRHLYGGAADIYVDVAPRDGVMDDLDGNGRIDRGDAVWLRNRIERWSGEGSWRGLAGGLSVYGNTAAHGPFVHVDVRGYRARW